jgi:putative heme-binding domain-containing protein
MVARDGSDLIRGTGDIMSRIFWPGLLLFLVVGSGPTQKPRPLDALVHVLAQSDDVSVQRDILRGMSDALAGRRSVTAPAGWSNIHRKLSASKDTEVRERVMTLSVLFGDPQALTVLRKTAQDTQADRGARARALQTLIDRRAEGVTALLSKLLDDSALVRSALRGLAACGDERTPGLILARYTKLDAAAKADAIGTLSSRPGYALALLEAVEKKQVPRADVSAYTARQLVALNDRRVTARLEAVWGSIRPASQEKERLLARYRKLATPAELKKANRGNGRVVFDKTCASCHVLFGQGSKIGPDLTGSQRANPEYVLHKLLDPHSVVPRDYQVTRLVLASGRIITGLIKQEADKVLVVQTPTEEVRVQKSDIDQRNRQKESLMPEGLLKPLGDRDVRDLLAYLASPEQVSLPPRK